VRTRLTAEAKNDEKAVKQALKDLERAHKGLHKAQKAEHDANEDHQKAIRREEKLAAELIKLQHEHESAIATKETLAKELVVKHDEVGRLGEEVKRLQVTLEQVQERARVNNERRAPRLAALSGSDGNSSQGSLPAAAGAAAGAGAGSLAGRRSVSPATTTAGASLASPLSGKGELPAGEFGQAPPPLPARDEKAALAAGLGGGAAGAGTAAAAPPLPARQVETAAAPNLPPRKIDTAVQDMPGGLPSAASAQSQSLGQGYAPPPRHPVADASAPHVTSPTQTAAPQLPPRQGTAETYATAPSVPPSATSVNAPQLPEVAQQVPQQVSPGAHPNLLPGAQPAQGVHPNLLPGGQ
jgi:hypothetical protein